MNEEIISSDEINKKDLPYKFSEMIDDFIREKTEVEIRESAPEIDLNRKPILIVRDLEKNYFPLFDNFADWIYEKKKNDTTLSETNQKNKLYYHGRKGSTPYRGDYLYLTDDFGYAASYSDAKIVYAYTLNFPESKLFSIRNSKHLELLKKFLDTYSIETMMQSSVGTELDWASFSLISTDDFEDGEDLLSSLGFKGVRLNERKNITSVYIFSQNDVKLVEEIDITTPEKTKFIGSWHKSKEKEWNLGRDY